MRGHWRAGVAWALAVTLWPAVALCKDIFITGGAGDLANIGATVSCAAGAWLWWTTGRAATAQHHAGRHAAASARSVNIQHMLLAGVPTGLLIAIVSAADLPRMQALFNLGFGGTLLCSGALGVRWLLSRHGQHATDPASPAELAEFHLGRAMGRLERTETILGRVLRLVNELNAEADGPAPDLDETAPQEKVPLTVIEGGKHAGLPAQAGRPSPRSRAACSRRRMIACR